MGIFHQVEAVKAAKQKSSLDLYAAAIRRGDAKAIASAAEAAGVIHAQIERDLSNWEKVRELSEAVKELPTKQAEMERTKAEVEKLEAELLDFQNKMNLKLKPLQNRAEQLRWDVNERRLWLDQLHGYFRTLYSRGLATPDDVPAAFREQLVKDAEAQPT